MKIKGTIIDKSTKSPLQGVEVMGGDNSVKTNKKGKFSIDGEEVENLSFTIDGYSPLIKIPYNNDGDLKKDLGVIELIKNSTNFDLEKIQSSQLDNDSIEKLSSQGFSSSATQQKILDKSISKIKILLIPFILTLLTKFGISNGLEKIKNPETLLNPSCPTDNELKDTINKRNKLVKQLNSLYTVVNNTLTAISITEGVLITLQTLFTTLKFLPIPTPPPPSPSLVPPIQDIKPEIQKSIDKFSSINTGVLLLLTILRDSLQQALDLLKLLDQQIQNCSKDSELDSINEELRNINNQPKTSLTPTEVNGFNFGIETENTTNSLKRKRAIAKNKQGVILLRGEYSFSSSDQILIDELIFYIQTNDLKAD